MKDREPTSSDTISTEAWVLYAGAAEPAHAPQPGRLRRETFEFSAITAEELLVEPIYGCWEANMTHALERSPVDICRQRQEEKVVLGNAGVVRVLEIGDEVTTARPGDVCVVFGTSVDDDFGYPITVLAYDTPGTIGVLAKRIKLHQKNVIPIPQDSRLSLAQWAAFSVRYISAWANWQVAYKCWQSQMAEVDPQDVYVAAWGGGVSLAQCELARLYGCQAIMTASSDERMRVGRNSGIVMLDRREFPDLHFDARKYRSDAEYREAYQRSEEAFLAAVRSHTGDAGVAIFVDNIGTPVYRATLKALGRQGVIATCGWKHGMKVTNLRAVECIQRHIHVHTHYARYSEGLEAVAFAHDKGWMPPPVTDHYRWNDLPKLSADYAAGRIESYFPVFSVNPE